MAVILDIMFDAGCNLEGRVESSIENASLN